LIVQCSNCQTRYSIDGSMVDSSESPRFHCSRCDHYFELGSETESPKEEENEIAVTPPETEGEQMSLLDAMSGGLAQPDISTNIGSEIDYSEELFEAFQMEEENEEEQVDSLSLPPHQNDLSLSDSAGNSKEDELFTIPSIYGEETEQPTIEASSEKSELELLSQYSNSEDSLASSIHVSAKKNTRSHGPAADWPAPQQPVLPGQVLGSKPAADEDYIEDLSDFNLPGSYYSKEPENRLEHKAKPLKLSFPGTWRKLALTCSVPLLLLLGIFLLSQKMEQLPGVVRSYLSLTPTDLAAVPPAGVQILGLSSKQRMLDDGTTLLDFSGEIFNASATAIKDTVIEIRLFNREGHQIRRETAFSSGGLAKAENINTLPVETIQKMQKKPAKDRAELNANGGRKRFKVLMLDPPGEASWYSARIYSVETAA